MKKASLLWVFAALMAASPLGAAEKLRSGSASLGDLQMATIAEQKAIIDDLQKERQELIARIEELQRQNAELNEALDRVRGAADGVGEYRPT